MNKILNLILYAQNGTILISCCDESKFIFLKNLGAKRQFFNRNKWKISYNSKLELSKYFTCLRNEKFMFAGGSNGWQPSDIFQHLRNEGYLEGKMLEVVWTNTTSPTIREI